MPSTLDRFRLRQSTRSNLLRYATQALALLGELHFSTDDGRVYVWDNSRMLGVSTNTAVCNDGQVVVHEGEIVCN